MKHFKILFTLILAASLGFTACGSGSDSSAETHPSSIFATKSVLEPGEICPAGGVKIEMGFDVNRNNVLDQEEITKTEYVCNGEDASSHPFVVYTSPTPNETDVEPDTVISAVFNTEMNDDTINTDTFYIKDYEGSAVAGTVTYSGIVAYFTPTNPLHIDKKYTVTLSSGIENNNDLAMGYDHKFYFTCGKAAVIYKANGATGGSVPIDQNRYNINTNAIVLGNTGLLVKDNCQFMGWSVNQNGTGTILKAGDLISISNTSIILYAVWYDNNAPVEEKYKFTVSGLRGTLTIDNSGIENITFTQDGEYLIPTKLKIGNSYSLTIGDQPPHQTCVIDNSSGSISSSETGISINCTSKEKNGFLTDKIITVSPGHGYSYYTDPSGWAYQRSSWSDLIEDILTQNVVIDYLMPALRGAGASVISTRETARSGSNIITDSTSHIGSWTSYTGGYANNHMRTTVSGSESTASWTISTGVSGFHSVYISYLPGNNNSSSVSYTINHAGGTSKIRIDQSRWSFRPSGETASTLVWYPAGEYYFEADTDYTITLTTKGSATGKTIIADAVRLGGGMGSANFGGGFSGVASWYENSLSFLSSFGQPYWMLTNDITCRSYYSLYMGSDAYISVHFNQTGTTPAQSGTMSFIWGNEMFIPADPDIVPSGTYDYAQKIHSGIIDTIRGYYDAAWSDRSIMQNNLGELRTIKDVWLADPTIAVPAALFEIAFLDNLTVDNVYCKDTRFRKIVTRGMVTGLIDYFAQKEGITAAYPPLEVSSFEVQVTDNIITLSWLPTADTIHSGKSVPEYYFIYTSPDGIIFSAEPISTINTSYTFDADNVNYRYFKVSAYNSHGEGILTDAVYIDID